MPPKPDFIQTEPVDTEPDKTQEIVYDHITTDDVDSVDPQEIVSDGITTDDIDSVDPQEPVDDEGRTESDN